MSYFAEQNIIGSLLLDMNMLIKIYGQLKPEMFQSELLAKMYVEFLRAYDQGQELHVVQLRQKLLAKQYPERVIMQELAACVSQTVTSVTIEHYAKEIIDAYRVKQFSRLLNSIRPSCAEMDAQIGKLMQELEALQTGEKTGAKELKEIVEENKDQYFREREEEKLYTGFSKLDDLLGGLEGGDVIVIGARPAVGKSAFVTQIASNLATQGKRVGFYNLEMREKQVYERFVVNHSGISLSRLRRAQRFLGDEKERFEKANAFLSRQQIVISTGSKTVSQIRKESRHMDFDILILDYLQLIRADVHYQSRASEVGAISKSMKALAMELNVPIVALSQLNRMSEGRETKEPTMAELREAGDIEQDASIIALLWNLTEDRKKKGLKVDKNRQGQAGKLVLEFDGEQMCFQEMEESIEEVKEQAKEWSRVKEKTPFD